jgi:hypothetical protein
VNTCQRAAFITGWKVWVSFGYVPPSDHPDVLAGFQAAAAANERGGARPTVEDALGAATEYKRECDAEMLVRLREAHAAYLRLRSLAFEANKRARVAAEAWNNLLEQASPETAFQHAQDRKTPA